MGVKLDDLPERHRAAVLRQLSSPGGNSTAGQHTPAARADLESDLHDFILEHAHSRGWLCVHSRMDRPTTTAVGVSDFIIVTPKTVLFVEAKRPGKKTTPKQEAFLMAVRCLGWPTAVVHTQEEYLTFVK